MAVYEDSFNNSQKFDDSYPLSCKIENNRTVNGHVEYIIRVQRGTSDAWTIFRRFKEFDKLDKDLRASSFNIRLPPKKIIGNMVCQFILLRQEQLQIYMNTILDNLILASSIHLKRFLDPENKCYNIHFREVACQYASMALRGITLFHNLRPLIDVGWRYNKQYCKVKRLNEAKREYILSWISAYGAESLSNKDLQAAFKVLSGISHPFIMPIICCNSSPNGTLIIRPDCIGGSLRELIYSHLRFDDFISKCVYPRDRILIEEEFLITISVQVLHALMFLHQKNIPYGNLHVGNIFLVDNVAKITDVENSVFGLWSFYKRLAVQNRRIKSIQDLDIYCFGHVLYEMANGERLQSVFLNDAPLECSPIIKPVLELILVDSRRTILPTVPNLFDMEPFKKFLKMDYEKPWIKMNAESKQIFTNYTKAIEEQLNGEQNQLRRLKKLEKMQAKLESEERNENSKQKKQKLRIQQQKGKSETSTKRADDDCENISNSSIPPIMTSADSSLHEIPTDSSLANNDVQTAPTSSDSRNEFLRSIVNFNHKKLKKIC